MMESLDTLKGIIASCNKFRGNRDMSPWWTFHIQSRWNIGPAYGYIPKQVIAKLPRTEHFVFDDGKQTLSLIAHPDRWDEAMQALLGADSVKEALPPLKNWPGEHWPVLGVPKLKIPCGAGPLFGIVTAGVHLTIYTGDTSEDMKIWVGRRAADNPAYPAMLDSTVAGGMHPWEPADVTLIRKVQEETSMVEEFWKANNPEPVGEVRYFNAIDIDEPKVLGLEPGIRYSFAMRLDPACDWKPVSRSPELATHELMTVREVLKRLVNKEFKPNSGLIMLHFLVRKGVLRLGESDRQEVIDALEERLPLATE